MEGAVSLPMMKRSVALVSAAIFAAVLSACSDDDTHSSANTGTLDAGVAVTTVRLVNLARTELTLWRDGDPLDDATWLPDGTISRCLPVNAHSNCCP